MPSFRETASALARNLKLLMEHHELSQAQLAKDTGIGQSTLSVILNQQDVQASNPTIETVERIAARFRLPAWILVQPSISPEMLLAPGFAKLIEAYSALPVDARQSVDRIAEAMRVAGAASATRAAGGA